MAKHIKEIYSSLFEDQPRIASRIKEQHALSCWDEIVSPEVLRHTQTQKIARGVLHVLTTSPAWSQELSFLKSSLIEKLNQKLGEGIIHDIRFVSQGRKKSSPKENKYLASETNCSICGITWLPSLEESKSSCPQCRRVNALEQRQRLHRLLSETPWLDFKNLQGELSGARIEEYERVKRDRKGDLYDRMWQIAKELEKASQPALTEKLKRVSWEYSYLQTGIPPQAMDDEIVKRVVGERIFEYMNGGKSAKWYKRAQKTLRTSPLK